MKLNLFLFVLNFFMTLLDFCDNYLYIFVTKYKGFLQYKFYIYFLYSL